MSYNSVTVILRNDSPRGNYLVLRDDTPAVVPN